MLLHEFRHFCWPDNSKISMICNPTFHPFVSTVLFYYSLDQHHHKRIAKYVACKHASAQRQWLYEKSIAVAYSQPNSHSVKQSPAHRQSVIQSVIVCSDRKTVMMIVSMPTATNQLPPNSRPIVHLRADCRVVTEKNQSPTVTHWHISDYCRQIVWFVDCGNCWVVWVIRILQFFLSI